MTSRSIVIFLAAVLAVAVAIASTYTDTLNADFNAGNATAVNVTGDSVTLPFSSGGLYNTSGIFYSQAFDLGSNPSATINWSYSTPTGTSILISSRSGNNSVAGSTGWGSWSSDYATSTGSTVTSTMNRYYQYRAQLATTDNTTAPTVNDVTLIYTEANTTIETDSSLSGDLTGSDSGNYAFYVNVSDTFSVVSVSGRYRLYNGSSASSYSSSTSLSVFSGTVYNITLTEPSGGWDSYTNYTSNGTAEIEITAIVNDGSQNYTRTEELNETIEFANTAPTIDPISNETLQQDEDLNITVSGGDVDGQSLTFTTNTSSITVTALTSTSASLTWTPNSSEVGVHTVRVYANDSLTTNSTTFVVNVSDVNDAPELDDVDEITGYHGIRQTLTLTATDADSGANITFSMSPDFFDISTETDINGSAAPTGTYYGFANFTPADEEDGVQNVTFYVTDGYETTNTTATMSIDYCGDAVCQSTYEDDTTCPLDCADTTTLDVVALVVPDRNCVNAPIVAYTFNATNRYSCYYKGLVEQGLALCQAIDGAAIEVYYRNGTLLVEKASLTSGTNGSASYTATAAGEYKFSASADGFANTSSLVYVRDCSEDIVVVEQNETISQPDLPPSTSKPGSSTEEEPGQTEDSASLFSIMLFYFVIPILLATLTYTSFVFYDVNKDTLPWILEVRIFFYEQRMKYAPTVMRAIKPILPYLTAAADALEALYVKTLKPVVDLLLDKLKKR